jgi:hypothetical protein
VNLHAVHESFSATQRRALAALDKARRANFKQVPLHLRIRSDSLP